MLHKDISICPYCVSVRFIFYFQIGNLKKLAESRRDIGECSIESQLAVYNVTCLNKDISQVYNSICFPTFFLCFFHHGMPALKRTFCFFLSLKSPQESNRRRADEDMLYCILYKSCCNSAS